VETSPLLRELGDKLPARVRCDFLTYLFAGEVLFETGASSALSHHGVIIDAGVLVLLHLVVVAHTRDAQTGQQSHFHVESKALLCKR
jgi:hypothetical protein